MPLLINIDLIQPSKAISLKGFDSFFKYTYRFIAVVQVQKYYLFLHKNYSQNVNYKFTNSIFYVTKGYQKIESFLGK